MMIPVGARPNAVVTLHNSSALLTGVCQVAGAALAFVGIDRQQDPRLRRQHVVLACLGITVLVILFATAVMKRLFPPLFVQGHGPTAWHQAVLGTAMGLFAISGLAFAGLHLFSKARCVFWYSLALFLIATGLLCFFVQNSVGDPVSWLGRGSHYLAGVYLLIAVVVASREIRLKGDELYQGIEDLFRHRLELLVEERTAQLRRANVQLSHEIAERIRAEEALKVAHAELELKVQERTAQLSEANEALRKEVAQRERSAKALRERTEALERANKELEHFAYIASHDLREPLRKISTFTELLAKRFKGQLDEKGDKYIWYVVDGAQRMERFIDDLLAYSRAGRAELRLEQTSVEDDLEKTL
ncbi:MAG: hypothetical protein FJY85_16900, partial [Deltaproteobacteria bacterium]|nr:hypothetical protein [Deltaproteobacteria bacterium]